MRLNRHITVSQRNCYDVYFVFTATEITCFFSRQHLYSLAMRAEVSTRYRNNPTNTISVSNTPGTGTRLVSFLWYCSRNRTCVIKKQIALQYQSYFSAIRINNYAHLKPDQSNRKRIVFRRNIPLLNVNGFLAL